MSEYQFYEFAAIDGPLSDKGMAYAESVTGRAEVTPWRWKNVYNWGDFRGSVEKMMQHYDAHVYLANWGTFRFTVALPKDCFEAAVVEPCLREDAVELSDRGDRYVLTWTRNEEEGWECVDGEGILDGLLPIRDELLRGDLRSLYLGWLADVCWYDHERDDEDEAGDEPEPPVPPGLGKLTSAQKGLVEQLGIDEDYLAAAADLAVPEIDTASALRQAVEELKTEDAREYLLRVAQGEGSRVMAELNWMATRHARGGEAGPRRCVRELSEAAVRLRAERERRKAQAQARKRREKEAKRKAHLEDVLARSEAVWQEVDSLAEQKTAAAYDQIGKQVHDLSAAHALGVRAAEFEARLSAFRAKYSRRPALMRRIKDL